MKITLDQDALKHMNVFQNITGVSPIDCIDEEGVLNFVVPLEELGKAIGKNGRNIKNLKLLLKKNIYIFGFVDDLQSFLKVIFPNAKSININGRKVIVSIDNEQKAMTIGANGKNIKIKRKLLKRFFDIEELKIR